VDEHLSLEFPIERKDLDTAIGTVRYIYFAVIRHLDRMHGRVELQRARTLRVEHACSTRTAARPAPNGLADDTPFRDHIDRLVAERSPRPLERAGGRVEHRNAAVTITVRNEDLVGRLMNRRVRRLVDTVAVPIPADLPERRGTCIPA